MRKNDEWHFHLRVFRFDEDNQQVLSLIQDLLCGKNTTEIRQNSIRL